MDPALPGARNPHVLMATKVAVHRALWLRITRYGFERGILLMVYCER